MKFYFILVAALLTAGCTTSPPTDSLKTFPQQINVSWQNDLKFPTDSLGNPGFIHATAGRLIFAEPHGEKLLLAYNPDSGTVARLLSYGKAEDECMNVHQIGTYPTQETESFYVYDNYQKKVFIYTLQSDTFTLSWIQPAPEGVKTFSFLTKDRILGCAADSSRYLRADTSGKIDCRFGDYAEFGLPIPVGAGLLQGLSLAVSRPDGTERYAWFSFYGSGYQIIGSEEDSCRIIQQTMYKMPEFQIQSAKEVDYPVFGQNTEIGYAALTTDGKYIYALYSGHTLAEVLKDKDIAWRSRHICVYDWDGTPRLLMNADRDLKTLTYDAVHDRLYALSMDEPGIYSLFFLDLNGVRPGLKE